MPLSRRALVSAGGVDLYAAVLALSPAAWVGAQYITGLSDGNSVNTWSDISGNSRNAMAGTAPVYKTNILNGKPVVRFTAASSQYLTFGTALGRTANYTIFIVAMITDTTPQQTFLRSMGSSPSAVQTWFDFSNWTDIAPRNTLYYCFGNDTNGSDGRTGAVITANQYFIGGQRYTAGQNACDMWFNGESKAVITAATAATAATGTSRETAIGRGGAYGGWYLGGDMAEAIIFTKALTTSEMLTVHKYLSEQWGIALA